MRMYAAVNDFGSRRAGPALRSVGALFFLVGLGLFLVRFDLSSVIARAFIGLSIALAPGARSGRLARSERKWLRATLLFFLSLGISALVVLMTVDLSADRKSEVILDIPRQAFMLLTTVAIFLHLRSERARRIFAAGITVIGVVSAAEILVDYVKFAGFSFGKNLAEFKAAAYYETGLNTNPVSFAAVLGVIIGWSWW